MSNFTFDSGIPFAQNNPSSDQPKMLANNIANEGIWDIDHIGFNSNNGGTHLQTSFEGFSSGVLLAGTPSSTAYPAAGVADATRADYYFKNSAGIFLLNAIRAFAFVDGATGAILNSQSINVASIVRNSAGNYSVTLTANAVSSASFAVLVSSTKTSGPRFAYSAYNITGVGTFNLLFDPSAAGSGTDVISFSFQVLQI